MKDTVPSMEAIRATVPLIETIREAKLVQAGLERHASSLEVELEILEYEAVYLLLEVQALAQRGIISARRES